LDTEKEDDVQVFLRKAASSEEGYHFFNHDKGWQVSLNEEQFE
jgi:hypothetical protein